jgi:serine/threonine protein kinase/Tol biopolymer transport system component
MSLEPGKQLGPYEVLAPLGAGGMGEVYRAKDTRLDRTVALKVLPSNLSANPVLRERLEREAKAISGLAHPHICTLHDVGQDDGIDYLVMEYLEGDTLADRLQKGPLPLEQALKCGIEIAEALDAAHRQGVVHRDLKPGNVMLTKSGAKLLDFGLAKLREGDPSDPATSASAIPTEHRPLTEIGTILGTYPYMAPEQLEGKDVDGRADLFAFGAMLHEMVTGHRAFDGESRASLIAAILEREPPPVSTLQPLSPPGLDHVVKTCLAKDPDDRWQSARDVASELRWIKEAGSQAGMPAPAARRKKTRERLVWALSAIALLAIGAGGHLAWSRSRSVTPPVVRSSLLPPEGTRFDLGWGGVMALSPDGALLAFVARGEAPAKNMLWVLSLDSLAARPLAGSEGARDPFWSPDGRFIAFFSKGQLRKIDASGGPPQTLCETSHEGAGTWGPDATILFGGADVIYKVPASGGTPVPVTALDESRKEQFHAFPEFLPGGKHFIFLAVAGEGTSGTDAGGALFAASLDSMEKTPIVASRSSARYSGSGHLLFLRDGTLVAQPFDPRALELSGDAVPIAENMDQRVGFQATFSLSETGFLVFQKGGASEARLVWLDRAGRELDTVGRPAAYYNMPVLSHDQKRVAVGIMDPETGGDIWVIDVERGATTRLTTDPTGDYRPLWSIDDRTIYFTSNRLSPTGDIHSKPSSGTGTAELVYRGEDDMDVLWSVSPDGTTGWLWSYVGTNRTDIDILRINLETLETEVVVGTPFREALPAISPDGRWLLYQSNESGRNQVYVQSLRDDGGKWPISIDGGRHGRWTRDGREIVFQTPDGMLMAVEVALEPTFSVGIPKALFNPGSAGWPEFDVTPDGERFLVNQPIDEPSVEPLTLVQNWTSALER